MYQFEDNNRKGGTFHVDNSITNFNKRLLNGTITEKATIGVTYRTVLMQRRSLFGFLTLLLNLSLWTFIDTTLADKLQDDFSVTSEIVSIIYAIQMGGFLVTSLFVHKALDQYVGTLIIIIAFIVQALATWLIGPSYLLGAIFPNSLGVIIPGLLLTGLAGSFSSIAAYSEMHDPFVEAHPNCDREKLANILSGLYNAGFSMGTILGPVVGSYITIWSGSFRVCSDFFAIVTFIYCLALFGFVYYPFAKTETMKYR